MAKHCLIIAGLPASGKTFTLMQAIQKKIPVFGDYSNLLFDMKYPHPSSHLLKLNSLAQVSPVEYRFIRTLIDQKNSNFPENLVLHLDISTASNFRFNKYEEFYDSEFIISQLEITLDFLISSYEIIYISTLQTSLPIIRDNYIKRSLKKNGEIIWRYPNLERLYEGLDHDLFYNIMFAWKRYSEQRTPNLQFI